MQANASEIAHIRQQIEAECQSLYLIFSGYAAVSTHEAIAHRYQAIEQQRSRLVRHVGEEEATSTVIDIHNKVIR
jgi:hypothetical protein